MFSDSRRWILSVNGFVVVEHTYGCLWMAALRMSVCVSEYVIPVFVCVSGSVGMSVYMNHEAKMGIIVRKTERKTSKFELN